jgi:hypothetical protein
VLYQIEQTYFNEIWRSNIIDVYFSVVVTRDEDSRESESHITIRKFHDRLFLESRFNRFGAEKLGLPERS